MMFKPGDRVAFILDGHETEILWSGYSGELVQVAGVRGMIRSTDLRPASTPTEIPNIGDRNEDNHPQRPRRIRAARKPE
jgi:hypothetical protein